MNTNMSDFDRLVTLLYQIEAALMEDITTEEEFREMFREGRTLAWKCLFHSDDRSPNVGMLMQLTSHGFWMKTWGNGYAHTIYSPKLGDMSVLEIF